MTANIDAPELIIMVALYVAYVAIRVVLILWERRNRHRKRERG